MADPLTGLGARVDDLDPAVVAVLRIVRSLQLALAQPEGTQPARIDAIPLDEIAFDRACPLVGQRSVVGLRALCVGMAFDVEGEVRQRIGGQRRK